MMMGGSHLDGDALPWHGIDFVAGTIVPTSAISRQTELAK